MLRTDYLGNTRLALHMCLARQKLGNVHISTYVAIVIAMVIVLVLVIVTVTVVNCYC